MYICLQIYKSIFVNWLQIGDPQDEHDHLVHHNATDVLRFNVCIHLYYLSVTNIDHYISCNVKIYQN